MPALYDIIITKIPSDEARKLLARQLARDPSISMTEAMGILERLPAIFMREVADHDVPDIQSRLRSMRVETKALLRRRDPLGEPVHRSADVHVSEPVSLNPSPAAPTPAHRVAPPAPRVVFDSVAPATSGRKSPLTSWIVSGVILVIAVGVIAYVVQHPVEMKPPTLTYGNMPVPPAGTLAGPSGTRTHSNQSSKKSPSAESPASQENTPADSSRNKKSASSVTAADRHLSDQYLDSAMNAKGSFARNYYHLAISLNPNNVKAWNGLIAVCRAEGDNAAADSVCTEMGGRFGQAFDAIADIVHPYGDLVDYTADSTGVCRIEYRTRGRGRENLEYETYEIVKALAAHRDCLEISLYASTGRGSGMLVRIKTVLIPPVAREFSRVAMITYLE